MQAYLLKFIILLIAIMPLLSPIRPDIGWINAAPELFKTAWGVSTVFIAFTWWLFIQYKSREVEILKTPLYTPIFGFLIWAYVTLLWIEDGYLAIIMLSQFSASALIFFLILNSFKDRVLVEKIPTVLVISMILVSLIGLVQYYNPDSYLVQNFFAQAAKPSSTFGNKNMASHFVVMILPISIVLMLSSKNTIKMAYYAIVIVIGFWFLMNAAARQAWVAMAVELFLLLVFILLDRYKNKERSFVKSNMQIKQKSIAIVGIVLTLVFVANIATEGSFHRGSNKLEFVKKIDVEGVSSRFPAWINTIEMIKENPIAGVGVGQWPESYPRYYDRKMKDTFFNENVRLEKAHNDYLEILANFGLIGYGFLLWLVFLVVIRIWRVLVDYNHHYRMLILGLSLGLVGFLVVASVSFPVRVFLPAFLVLVFVAIITLLHKSNNDYDAAKFRPAKIINILVLACASCFTIFIVIFSNKWILSEYHYSNAKAFKGLSMNELQVKAGLKALSHNKYSPNTYIIVAEGLIRLGHAETAILYIKKAIDISPFNSRALLVLAQIYRSGGSKDDLKKEREILEFILTFDDKNVKALAFLTRSLSEEGRANDAAITYQRMKNSFEYFKDRYNFGPYHNYVGFVAISINDINYAQYVYRDAVNKFPNAENYINLGMVEFDLLKNKPLGIEMYKKALTFEIEKNVREKVKAVIDRYESSNKG